MANRKLRIGDRVVVRPGCVERLAREWGFGFNAHESFAITGTIFSARGRRILELDVYYDAWPSEVRLADGATERADVRFEQMERDIEAMKAKRREQKKGARKP